MHTAILAPIRKVLETGFDNRTIGLHEKRHIIVRAIGCANIGLRIDTRRQSANTRQGMTARTAIQIETRPQPSIIPAIVSASWKFAIPALKKVNSSWVSPATGPPAAGAPPRTPGSFAGIPSAKAARAIATLMSPAEARARMMINLFKFRRRSRPATEFPRDIQGPRKTRVEGSSDDASEWRQRRPEAALLMAFKEC
jgi:hypothetical protein